MAIFDEKIEIRERCKGAKEPPFIEVLSGLLRAAYWPLVFSFSSFSGLFWPGPFFPIFRQWIPKRCKGVHFVDLGESFLFEQIANSNAYLLAKCGFDTAENEPFKVR